MSLWHFPLQERCCSLHLLKVAVVDFGPPTYIFSRLQLWISVLHTVQPAGEKLVRKPTRAETVMVVMHGAGEGPGGNGEADLHPEGPGHLATHAERRASDPPEAVSQCST